MGLNLGLQLPDSIPCRIELVPGVGEGIIEGGLMIDGGNQLVAQRRDFIGEVWVVLRR